MISSYAINKYISIYSALHLHILISFFIADFHQNMHLRSNELLNYLHSDIAILVKFKAFLGWVKQPAVF